MGFYLRHKHGFQIEFSNGIVVSVIFGAGTYSENRDNPIGEHYLTRDKGEALKLACEGVRSEDAEVAIFKPEDISSPRMWLTKEWKPDNGDDVKGYCTPEEVLDAMIWASKYQ
jgi:hypothetical protein